MRAELGDKTFLLLLAFTICWTNLQKNKAAVEAERKQVDELATEDENLKEEAIEHIDEVTKKLEELNMSPTMLVFASIVGTLGVTLYTIYWQKNIYDNSKRLISALLLVICLMSYTFELVGVHLTSIGNFDKIQSKANAEVKRYG